MFLGEIPSDTRTRVREQFRQAQELFGERFAGGPVDYTVYVAASDRSAEAAHKHVFGAPQGSLFAEGLCERSATGFALFVILANCRSEPLRDSLGAYHFEEVLERVAPAHMLTPWMAGHEPPRSLLVAVGNTGLRGARVSDALGIEPLDEAHRMQAEIAGRTAESLRSYSAYPDPGAFPDEVAEALSFLAGDWLVARAGEPAIFEYYRLLGSTDRWEDAFETAFGIAINDFYVAFAEYRAAAAPFQPPPPEGPDAPDLVLLGELSAWEEARVLAHFEATQAFFRRSSWR